MLHTAEQSGAAFLEVPFSIKNRLNRLRRGEPFNLQKFYSLHGQKTVFSKGDFAKVWKSR